MSDVVYRKGRDDGISSSSSGTRNECFVLSRSV